MVYVEEEDSEDCDGFDFEFVVKDLFDDVKKDFEEFLLFFD
jgi:hypothetical protein